MKALHAGGSPAYILPAYAYSWLLPQLGFDEVAAEGYSPQTGDIVVFPKVDGHIWGHIQMWNGQQWISDFMQKGFYAAVGDQRPERECKPIEHTDEECGGEIPSAVRGWGVLQ